MNNALNTLQNNALAALSARAPQGIINAIKTASAKTGVSFTYLMEKAAAESNFKADAKAKTSSATGLFQFIESTWMDMVKTHGAKHGIDTSQSKSSLLNLRKDPEVASLMAAEFAEGNKSYLEKTIGGDIGNTELYFAHFMGAGGASAFLSQLKKNPLSIAADIFPKEASTNRSVFYDRQTGAPKTLQQVYDFFDKKFSSDTTVASLDKPTNSLAHKPTVRMRSAGYQHMPPSLKQPITIREANSYAQNSLYQMQSQMKAFFSPMDILGQTTGIPSSLYGNIDSQTSLLLNMLRN